MTLPDLHLLVIAQNAATLTAITALIQAGNANRTQQIAVETLLADSLDDALARFGGLLAAVPEPFDLVLVERLGILDLPELQHLCAALTEQPLLILGDQEAYIEDPALASIWRLAGVADYLVREPLTSQWLRHALLHAAQPLLLARAQQPAISPLAKDSTPNHSPSSDYGHQLWRLFDKLFDNIPVIICAFTGPEHVYSYANSLYRQVVGNRDVVGKTIRQALPELEGQGIYELLDQVYATGVAYKGPEHRVLLQNDQAGPMQEFYFALVFAPFSMPVVTPLANQPGDARVSSEKMIFVVALDVSEHVILRRQLQEAHAQLNALFASAPLGLAFVDRELRFQRINPALAEINGLSPQAHIGKRPDVLVPDLDALENILTLWQQIIASGKPILSIEVTGRTPATPDEDQIWEESWFPVTDNNEVLGLGIVAENITQRKRAEVEREHLLTVLAQERHQLDELNQTLEQRVQERSRQVHGLASELTLAEQRERHRIAQILHDHIQQLLYGIDFRIALLAHSATADQQTLLDEFREIVQEAIRATRTLTVDLSPPVLQGEGLVQSLHWLAHQMEVIHSLKVTLDLQEPAQRPRIEIRVLMLQSVRELLFNVVKHAKVTTAAIYMRQSGDQLVVQVTDEGRGFDTSAYVTAKRTPETFGLYSIHERLQLFDGRVEIESTPGIGTCVTLTLPIMTENGP